MAVPLAAVLSCIVQVFSLVYIITPLVSCPNRFCGLMLTESTGHSTLVICVYMPSLSNPSAYTDYLNTLGELEGFITAHQCDDTLIVGDFNADFNRQGPLKQLVLVFMVDLDLVACDLSFQHSVGFTCECDDSSARSWIDHILSSQSLHSHLSNVHTLMSGSNNYLSDHLPLLFMLDVHCLSAPVVGSSQPSRHINWSKASSHDIDDYLDMISRQLPSFLPSIADCKSIHCSSHYDYLDDYAQEVISIILSCSSHCIPSRATTASRRLIGWNDRANKLNNESKFWYIESG